MRIPPGRFFYAFARGVAEVFLAFLQFLLGKMFRFCFGAKDGFCENFGVMWCTGWMNENIAFEPSVL